MSNKSLITTLIILSLPFGSCKKGDGDPFFSLLSRKARVSGEWKLSSIEGEKHSKYSTETWTKWVKTGDENAIITIASNVDTDVASTKTYNIRDYSMTINKDGTWSKIIQLDCEDIRETSNRIVTKTYAINRSYSGTWAFIGKTKNEFKNKERIILSLSHYVTLPAKWINITEYKDGSPTFSDSNVFAGYNFDYSAGEFENVYEIEMLKSKEMKWLLQSGSFVEETTLPSEPDAEYTAEYSEFETVVWKLK
ncbi:MAG: hypothetical protein ACI8ZM_002434 [Crocinitomix sp.]|jgi:hypothetical protein